jgi:1-acyl-sn-glycerol-3-phosphate acyltransferase
MAADFQTVRLARPVPPLAADRPVLIVPNHSTWWDGFLVYLLNREVLHRTLHLMMLEEQLRRFPFFARVGAFGISPGQRRGVADAVRYSGSVLGERRNALCVFPQGVLAPGGMRPLGFQRGIERILSIAEAEISLLPLAIRCEFLGERKPAAFLLPGEVQILTAGTFAGAARLEETVASLLERLNEMIVEAGPGPQGAAAIGIRLAGRGP